MQMKSKIKKHFSLYMVKKSIKKKKNNFYNSSQITTIKPIEIPRFLDPYRVFRLSGDIIFSDKPYMSSSPCEIGLFFPLNVIKRVQEIFYNQKYDFYCIKMDDIKANFDSIGLICERLMSLGDKDAKTLSDNLHIYEEWILKFERKKNMNKIEELSIVKNYNDTVDVLKMYEENKENFYISFHYQFCENRNGLIQTEQRISKKLARYIFESESQLYNYIIDNGVFDYFSVYKDEYFKFFHLLFSVIFKNDLNTMKTIINTIDGFQCFVQPKSKTEFIFNENKEIQTQIFMYILDENQLKINELNKKRENYFNCHNFKREQNLVDVLSFYYLEKNLGKNKNREAKKSNNCIVKFKEEDFMVKKRCQYKKI